MSDLLTVDEVATYLRTTKTTIYRWLKQGKIIGIKIGKEWRIDQSSLQNLVLESKNRIDTPGENSSNLWNNLNNTEHLLIITGSKDDLYSLESSFFKHACRYNHPMLKGCWWQDIDEVREKYTTNGLDVDGLEKDGLIKFVDFNQSYRTRGIYGPVDIWKKEILKNKSDVLWASGAPHNNCYDRSYSKLLEFESALNFHIKNTPVIGICPYVIDQFTGTSFDYLVSLMNQHSGTVFYSEHNNTLLRI